MTVCANLTSMLYFLYCIEGNKEVQNVNVTCRPKNHLPINVIDSELDRFTQHSMCLPTIPSFTQHSFLPLWWWLAGTSARKPCRNPLTGPGCSAKALVYCSSNNKYNPYGLHCQQTNKSHIQSKISIKAVFHCNISI